MKVHYLQPALDELDTALYALDKAKKEAPEEWKNFSEGNPSMLFTKLMANIAIAGDGFNEAFEDWYWKRKHRGVPNH